MFKPLLSAAASAALLFSVPLAAQQPAAPIAPADLLRHIQRLASDEFQGRAPGTEGERLTINYIAEQLAARGLEPAGADGTWFQPVRLVERRPQSSEIRWTLNGAPVAVEAGDILLAGKDAVEEVSDAPVIFAGHGVRMPERGIDQLAGADFRGAVALIVGQGPRVEGFPPINERVRTRLQATIGIDPQVGGVHELAEVLESRGHRLSSR